MLAHSSRHRICASTRAGHGRRTRRRRPRRCSQRPPRPTTDHHVAGEGRGRLARPAADQRHPPRLRRARTFFDGGTTADAIFALVGGAASARTKIDSAIDVLRASIVDDYTSTTRQDRQAGPVRRLGRQGRGCRARRRRRSRHTSAATTCCTRSSTTSARRVRPKNSKDTRRRVPAPAAARNIFSSVSDVVRRSSPRHAARRTYGRPFAPDRPTS